MSNVVDSDWQNWDKLLPLFHLVHGSSIHKSTKETPEEVIFGREACLPRVLVFGTLQYQSKEVEQFTQELKDHLKQLSFQLCTE